MLAITFTNTYVVQSQQRLADFQTNIFSIPREKVQLFAQISTSNTTISANLDAYVTGVFVQDFYSSASSDHSLTYIPAVDCSSLSLYSGS